MGAGYRETMAVTRTELWIKLHKEKVECPGGAKHGAPAIAHPNHPQENSLTRPALVQAQCRHRQLVGQLVLEEQGDVQVEPTVSVRPG